MSYSSEVLADSPVVYLPLTETSGNWADSGSDTTAFTAGSGITRSKTGPYPGITAISGNNASVLGTLSSMPTGLSGGTVTIECWVNTPSGSLNGVFVAVGTDANGWQVGIGGTTFDNGGHQLIIVTSAIAWNATGHTLSNGWHHIVCARGSGNSVAVYVDATLVATTTLSSPNTATSNVSFGGYNARFLSSTQDIASPAVYASTLSSTRVTAHYNAASATAFSGSVALTGSGTVVGAGSPGPVSSVALTGVGTLAGAGVPGLITSVALTGSGTVTGTGLGSAQGSSTLAGSGTLGATGAATVAYSGTVSLAGSGTVTAVGHPKPVQSLVLTGVGTLAGSGAAPPANDAWANAVSIAWNTSSSVTTGSFDNTSATDESGEDTYNGISSLWWKITPTTSGAFLLDASGSDFSVWVSVWIGSSVSTLEDWTGACIDQTISMIVTAGTTYYIRAASDPDTPVYGSIHLHVTAINNPALRDVPFEFDLSGAYLPMGSATYVGGAIVPTTSGTASDFTWPELVLDPTQAYLFEVDYGAADHTLYHPALTMYAQLTAGDYDAVWTDSTWYFLGGSGIYPWDGNPVSGQMRTGYGFVAPQWDQAVTANEMRVLFHNSGGTPITGVRLLAGVPLGLPTSASSDTFPGLAVTLTGGAFSSTLAPSIGATVEVGELVPAGNNRTVWWNFTPDATVTYTVDLVDATVAIYIGTAVDDLTLMAWSADSVTFEFNAGTTYYIQASLPSGSPDMDYLLGIGTVDLTVDGDYVMDMDVLGGLLQAAPTSVTITIDGGLPDDPVEFRIDGVWVDSATLAPDGTLEATSVNVPDGFGQGDHVLTVHSLTSDLAGEAIFTLHRGPYYSLQTVGFDSSPVEIESANTSTGVRRWILQDLMAGGLGSYVLPNNPTTMSSPEYQRTLSQVHTTAIGSGRYHLASVARQAVPWEFSGYLDTEEFASQLRDYFDLKRRFYVIDHRARAWIVTFTRLELIPRHRQYDDQNAVFNDWAHNYTVQALIYDQDWLVPQ